MAQESEDISDVLTNLAKPLTSATLTLRIIKSFEYRTEKSLVLHDINLETTTVGDLKRIAVQGWFELDAVCPSCLSLPLLTGTQQSTRSLGGNRIALSPLVRSSKSSAMHPADACYIQDTLKLYTKAHGAKVCPIAKRTA